MRQLFNLTLTEARLTQSNSNMEQKCQQLGQTATAAVTAEAVAGAAAGAVWSILYL